MDAQLYRDFAAHEDSHWWFAARRAIVREFLKAHLPVAAPRKILDVGCGTGGMLPLLQEFGEVSALDSSEEALVAARQRAPSARLWKGILPGGIPPHERFDVVTAFDVIEHVPEVVEALAAMRDAMAPDGRLLVTVPAYMFLWSYHDELNHHQRRYTDSLLRAHLESAGLLVERTSYFNSWLLPPIAAVRLAQRFLPKPQNHSDIEAVSPWLNRTLEYVFSSERFVVSKARLPAGVSLLALARRA